MSKKVMSREELLKNREQLIADYKKPHRRFQRKTLLTKKEKKVLGIGKDEGRAHAKNVRINPFKVNALIRNVKGKSLDEAIAILTYSPRGASPVLIKLIRSAEANAVNNNNLNRDNLFVAELYANEGPTLKRIMPRARGSATRILKRTSHITCVLRERE
ncbi:MAG TPA: 50S ribosomal protein L22 [Clostridiaceae bacterium]|jgi:large subunit ribosomal protein L22|nr:50S ribosomal protein L22 [Clostridiaceae bacterium]